jgi:hypothetical protein
MKQMLSALLFLVTTATIAAAEGPETKYQPPRVKDGRPDLQGVWNFTSGVPLQRSLKFPDKKIFTREEFEQQRAAFLKVLGLVASFAPVENVQLHWIDNRVYVDDLRTSLINYPENGRLPALMEGVRRIPGVEDILGALADGGGSPTALGDFAAAFAGGRKDSHTDFNRAERCLDVLPVPLLPQFSDSYVQIIQSSDSVALVTDGERRVIPISTTPAAPIKVRLSTGTSTGHWEGDTLVVVTTSFSARTPGFAGAGNSRDKTVTERFTRTPAGLGYSATVVDPSTFKDRIELSFPMTRVEQHIYEAACHEGNYSLANALSGMRKEEQE